MKKCVIFGASPISDYEYINQYLSFNEFIICADGGISLAQKLKKSPSLVVGDFDSYKGDLNEDCELIKLPTEKDDTDLMYCVKEAIKRGYDELLIFGALGRRLDHTYGNLCVLNFCMENNCKAVLYDDKNMIEILGEGKHTFNGLKDIQVSFFPFGCNECKLNYNGFKYGGENTVLTSSFPMGISNIIISEYAEINIITGKAIAIFSID